MATPYYVSPEQMMKDRAEYARKGIARGRALLAVEFDEGVVFVSENASRSLYKTSEIYDRIAFAAVGRYNEFEALRVSGIRLADVKGYQYGRQDVTAKSLANAYSQALGAIFMGENKPFEIEVLISQVNGDRGGSELYHILYDGSLVDEHKFVAIGGESEEFAAAIGERWEDGLTVESAVRLAVDVLSSNADREIPAEDLEVSGLDRSLSQRKFFRFDDERMAAILAGG
ncbi:MAG: proteasome subunit alpha [Nitriliruptorales bacterium]